MGGKHKGTSNPRGSAQQSWAPGIARMETAMAAAAGTRQPLLGEREAAELDPERGILVEGSNVTISEVAADVQGSLAQHPRETVKWIEEYGSVRLGSFRVHASKIPDLMEPGAVKTFGADSKDLDWQGEWLRRLGTNKKTNGPDHSALLEVEAFVVDIRNPAGADDEGILNPLLHQYNDRLCGARTFTFPAVKAVLDYKWDCWAWRFLAAEVTSYIIWLVSFQLFILLIQDEDSKWSLRKVVETKRGIFTLVFEALALVGMLPFLVIEFCTIKEYGFADWLSAWNVLDVLSYALQIAITVMHVARLGIHSNGFSVVASLQVLILWLRVQYFARCVQPTKNPFLETLRAVISDVKWFLALLLLTLWGFSCSFYILFRKDQQKQEFSTIWRSLSTMFSTMMGGFDLALYTNSHNPVVATTLLLVFVFTMSMVLLNCLVAIMCDAATRVNEAEGNLFLLARAQIIDELETTVPRALRQASWEPQYIHFLQVNREDGLVEDLDGPEAPEEEDETAERLAGLEKNLAEAQEQIRELVTLQQALVAHLLPTEKVEELRQQLSSSNAENAE